MSVKLSLKKFLTPIILAVIFILAAALMWTAATEESAVMDELAHIPAGFGYLRYIDYRLNPEHPPLLKTLSAIPLVILKVDFPVNHSSWMEDINGQWEAGTQFLYKLGNNADQMIRRARLAPIIFTLLTIFLVYFWSKEILGKGWALIPTLLFGFSPTTLAHGHYVTTDIAATFGLIIGTYFFIKFLNRGTPANIILAGSALGLAELTKFSNALLLPYFFILFTVHYSLPALRSGRLWQRLRSSLLILVIAAVIVYAVYFVFTVNYPPAKQLADAKEILASFSPRWLSELDLSLIKIKLLRPIGEYLLGLLMTLQRSAGGNTNYFLGEVSATGSHYYFPTVFLMKEPLPNLLLIGLAIILSFKNMVSSLRASATFFSVIKKIRDYLAVRFEEFAMLLFVLIYWAWSIKSPLNIGVRHLLPTIPFIYILSVGAFKRWVFADIRLSENIFRKFVGLLEEVFKRSAKVIFLIILIIWSLGESVKAFPYFLSYFNELAGGTNGGYRYVTDSNYDWGQDLIRLKKWAEKNLPAGEQIAVDYFGGGNPEYYLGKNVAVPWTSAYGNPKNKKMGWLAVSVNTLQNAFGKLRLGQERKPEDEYSWLKELRPPKPGFGTLPEPDYRAGTSIFIYKL